MSFFDYLVQAFGYNNPFFIREVRYRSYSMPWIKKNLGRLCKEGDIVRFDKGIYYIPTDTKIGKSELDPRLVVMKKYISTKKDVFGYYSGAAFLNVIGLSMQFPSVYEIYTNRETTRAREVVVGGQRLILKKQEPISPRKTMGF